MTLIHAKNYSRRKLLRQYRKALRRMWKYEYRLNKYTNNFMERDKRAHAQRDYSWWMDWTRELYAEIKKRGYWTP